MRSLLLSVTLVATMLLVASSAPAGEFYQWTDRDGTVNVTDDVKRIPKAYQAVAVKRNTEDLGKDANITPVTISGDEYAAAVTAGLDRLRAINARTVENPNRVETCDGPITVTQERHNRTSPDTSWTGSNTYNSMFYVVRDSCGNPTSVTLSNPKVLIIR